MPTMSKAKRRWLRALLLAGAAISALGAGAALGVFQSSSGFPEPRTGSLVIEGIPQTASAQSGGIQVSAESALFSGTETLVLLRMTITDPDQLPTAANPLAGAELLPVAQTVTGPFAGASGSVLQGTEGIVLRLPALSPGPNYDGTVAVSIPEVQLTDGRSSEVVTGDWNLVLTGPTVSSLALDLAVERFRSTEARVDGQVISIDGARSSTETVVEVTLPEAVVLPVPPLLVVNGDRLAPTSVESEPNRIVLSYPATKFGSQVLLELGDVAIDSREEGLTATISTESLLQGVSIPNADTPSRPLSVDVSDVLLGDPDFITGADVGSAVPFGTYIGITFRGTWPTEFGGPTVLNDRGEPLMLKGTIVGYTKTADGLLRPGETTVAVFVDPSDTRSVTFILGSRVGIVNGTHEVVLMPE